MTAFGYDGRNRLTTFNESVVSGGNNGTNWGQTNAYDRYGNRWATPYAVTQSDWTPTQQSNFDAAKNQITTAKNGGSTAPVTHDAAGYMTVHPQIAGTLVYDAEGRLLSGGGATYTYDGEGRRIKRVAAGSTYWYWYGADGGLIGEDTPEQIETGVQYLSTDALGSTRLVTKASQEVAARIDYWPFGEEIAASSPAGNRDLVSGYGGAAALKQRFTGKERDPEMGFDYFGARYLASAQGRWTSPDTPFADQKPEDPQSWNLYGYVRNNPLRAIDSDGRSMRDVGEQTPYVAGLAKGFVNAHLSDQGSLIGAGLRALGVQAQAASSSQQQAGMDAYPAVQTGVSIGMAIGGIGGKSGDSRAVSRPNVEAGTMRAGQRAAMREAEIPTSQQPTKQTSTPAGRQYEYQVAKPGGGNETKIVQRNNGTDRSHPGQQHVEAGRPKP